MRRLLTTIFSLFGLLSTAIAGPIDEAIDAKFQVVTDIVVSIVFYSFTINFGAYSVDIPFIVLWLLFGAIGFTIYFKFINFTKFKLAIDIVRGKHDSKDLDNDDGEVSHFQALATALSGTVGLGNIAGVAAAISLGGPGATFWMILAGFIGMSSKFAECTLGVKFRKVDENGTVHGGPMYYLSRGLEEKGLGLLGKILGGAFAVFCVFGSFGGGNMFQANQSFQQLVSIEALSDSWLASHGWAFGLILAVLVAMVILGGIKSIAKVTDKIVPIMVVMYVVAALIIIFANISELPHAFALIIEGAFNPGAALGGFLGVMIIGIKRAAFSNEAGVGSASIAHSAVKTKNPASEGIVALLEPFIDTVVVCTMTALVLIITDYHQADGLGGIDLTSAAFASQLPGAQYVIMLAAIMFAFSTMISWSYYGLQSWAYLFGYSKSSEYIYKAIFCAFIVIGASSSMGAVIDFSDCMILAMCFPNIVGIIILLPVVKRELNNYLEKIKN